ncbi:hypothetical protein LINPERPRIM_LOCUS26878 [Linum perenne]
MTLRTTPMQLRSLWRESSSDVIGRCRFYTFIERVIM